MPPRASALSASASSSSTPRNSRGRPPGSGRQQRARREQIAAACRACQSRKGKCDGQRPCKWCRDHQLDCEYEVNEGETLTRARKRKYEDLEQEHLALKELVNIAALRPDATDILKQIRAGRRIEDLLSLLKEGDITYQAQLGRNPRTRRMLLSLLIQSTASLDEIVLAAPRIAETQLDIGWAADDGDSTALKNRTIDAGTLISAVEGASAWAAQFRAVGPLPSESGSSRPAWTSRALTNSFSVPARPWTELTTDNVLVSHLVTIFLNYPNVYWRYVEEDLFLQSMKSGDLNADFCSPFLVNAICALACLSSEHSAVFLQPDDLISRGQHFHDEALRLWLAEDGRASLTNIQALVITSMGAGFRGKDKLGLSLIVLAAQMNIDLSFPPTSVSTITMSDTMRARVSASWTAHLFDTTNALGLLRTCTPIDSRLAFLPILPESERLWTGEPFLSTDTYFRPNALMRERCQLIRLTAELVNLIFSPADKSRQPTIEQEAKALLTRLEQWYALLPRDMQFHKYLPAPVYELHGHYYCALMTLHSSLDAMQTAPSPVAYRLNSIHPLPGPHQPAAPLILGTVLKAGNLLRHFRQTYGFKSSLAFIFQMSALVSSILLNYLSNHSTDPTARYTTFLQDDIEVAFAESYRCLLAIGTRVMIGRGVARMVYQSSRTANTPLPEATRRLLGVVGEVVWNSSDVRLISSSFPNWAMAKDAKGGAARMESLLKQWEEMGLEDGNKGG